MKKVLMLLVVAVVAFAACEKDEFIAEQNTTTLAKTWFVKKQGSATNYKVFSTRVVFGRTFDKDGAVTSYYQDNDTLQVDDHGYLTPTARANFGINVNTQTFSPGTYFNYNNTTDSVILKEGRIVLGGGRSKTGSQVDSIYIKYALKSAPATDHIVTGHSRTGLLQDEY